MAKRELDQKKEAKFSLFDFISDIGCDKQYRFNEDTKSEYNQFMIARAFGQHVDTVLLANELNKMGQISDEMHHDFLFYSVSPKNRYGKWAKKSNGDHQELSQFLMMKYQISQERSDEYIMMMTDEEIKQYEERMNAKGGKSK